MWNTRKSEFVVGWDLAALNAGEGSCLIIQATNQTHSSLCCLHALHFAPPRLLLTEIPSSSDLTLLSLTLECEIFPGEERRG